VQRPGEGDPAWILTCPGGSCSSFFEPAADACGGDYLCVARKGYDAPTGLGSPDGTRAF
jgi:hypothetical protein